MNIADISGQRVKISARSITVKDNNGKTRGIVRGVTAWKDAAFRDQVNAPRKGLWGTPEGMAGVYLYDRQWYYLHDVGRVQRAAAAGLDTAPYTARRDAAAECMAVIDCYIL